MDDEQGGIHAFTHRWEGLSDEELDREYRSQLAEYHSRLHLQTDLAVRSGLSYFTALEKAVASDLGVAELPSFEELAKASSQVQSKLQKAAVGLASARELFDKLLTSLEPDCRIDIALALSGAAEAGYLLAYHRAEPFLEEVADRTGPATEKRRRMDWREAARDIWRKHPKLTINAVAERLRRSVAAGAQRRSVARAIGPEAPPTSASLTRRAKSDGTIVVRP